MGAWERVRKPWVALGVVLAVGVVGGIAVYQAGGEIREQDRAAFLAWERTAQPSVERARAMHASLPDLISRARAAASRGPELDDLRAMLTKTRATLEHARNKIQAVRIERVLETVAAKYLEAIARDLQAVSSLQDIAGDPDAERTAALSLAEQRYATASERYREGDEARAMLRARLRLD